MRARLPRHSRLKIALAAALGLLLAACASGGGKSAAPPPDPAVAYANRIAAGPIGYTEGYFGEGERRLHYVEAGSGDLIILQHGFPSFWFSFFDQMEALKGRYRVVAIDGLGAGLSAKPEAIDAYRIDLLAADIDGLARHLAGDEPFILIGHDWGAALAFAFAQAFPQRLHKVIGLSAPPFELFLEILQDNAGQQATSAYMQRIIATPPETVRANPPGERIFEQSYAGLLASGDLSPEEGALFRAALRPADATNGGYNWYRANIPPTERFATARAWPAPGAPIAPPALLVWGEKDRTFDPVFIEKLATRSGALTVARLPGVGHWTSMEQAGQANEAILRFLDVAEQ